MSCVSVDGICNVIYCRDVTCLVDVMVVYVMIYILMILLISANYM